MKVYIILSQMRDVFIYVSSVQWGIGYLQFSFMFPMHVFIPPSLLHLKCYSRLLYNSFDFVCFVFIWKHLYLYCTLFQCDSISSSRFSTKYSLGLSRKSMKQKEKVKKSLNVVNLILLSKSLPWAWYFSFASCKRCSSITH